VIDLIHVPYNPSRPLNSYLLDSRKLLKYILRISQHNINGALGSGFRRGMKKRVLTHGRCNVFLGLAGAHMKELER